MKRTKKIILSLTFILVLIFSIVLVNAISEPNYVYTSSIIRDTLIDFPFQKGIIYANSTYWVFGIWDKQIQCYYSYDNITWVKEKNHDYGRIALIINAGTANGREFDIYYDGEFFYYSALYDNQYVHFRKGNLNSDGGITWVTTEQSSANLGFNCYGMSLTIDSEGYAYVSYYAHGAYNYTIIKNANNDGTWVTASGYPFVLLTSQTVDQNYGSLLSGENGKIYLVHNDKKSLSIYKYVSSWSYVDTITETTKNYVSFCARCYNDTVYITYLNNENIICFNKYENNELSETLYLASVSASSYPVLCVDTVMYDLYIIWFEGNYGKYIKYTYASKEWGNEETFTTILTDIYSNAKIQVMDKDYGDNIGLLTLFGSGAYDATYINFELNPSRVFTEGNGNEYGYFDWSGVKYWLAFIVFIIIAIFAIYIKRS